MTRLIILTCFVLLTAGCTSVAPEVQSIFGERDKVVRKGRLKVYRINPSPLKDKELPAMRNHELLAGPEYPAADLAKAFREVLLSSQSYPSEPPAKVKVCTFEPAIVLRFTEGPDAIEVMISFICNRIKVFHNDKLLGMRDIDPGRDQLLRLSRKVFPGDTYLKLMPPRET